jgi:murein DD-endopeptidase MepM/ murein hydrolase activator NlpD
MAAAILLAATAIGAAWLLLGGYSLGPRITVQEQVMAPPLTEPAPAEKPVGSSTAPPEPAAVGTGTASGSVEAGEAAGTTGAEAQGAAKAVSGRAAPAALSRLTWPVEGRVVRGYGYGFVAAYQDYRFHPGLDLAAPVGTPVRAAADGQVKEIAYDATHRWQVVLEHGDSWETVYLELNQVADLSGGAWVKAGTILGYLGEPGRTADTQMPHLHFELRHQGEARNPLELLP